MKKFTFLLLAGIVLPALSCKSLAKTAAKHWTKKQIKTFKKNCVTKSENKLPGEKAVNFCDCVTETLMEKLPDADKALEMDFSQLIREAGKCAF